MPEPQGIEPVVRVISVPAGGPGHEAEAAPIQIAFEAFGVRLVVAASSPELLERFKPYLPPGHQPCSVDDAEQRFTIVDLQNATYGIAKQGKGIARGIDLDLALELLDSQIRIYIGEHSPRAIFVHAGAVAHNGKVLVLPGVSFAGKTTLVTELIKAGATYYSDEFALIDDQGLVHPYAKPLSIRGDDLWQTHHHVDTVGGIAGDEALPVGEVALARYRPGAAWAPRLMTAGEGVLALLANTVPAQSRPAESMRALKAAVADAVILEGERGEAAETAPLLLAELDRL